MVNLCWLFTASTLVAEEIYQKPADFLEEIFHGAVPPVATIEIIGERRNQVTKILGHAPNYLKIRYWLSGQRSAWVLEEIGKVKPITAGIVVHANEIEDVRVLIYREGHGYEVHHKSFTHQFEGAGLASNLQLNKTIDGISGATLSVGSMRRIARVALYLHGEATSR